MYYSLTSCGRQRKNGCRRAPRAAPAGHKQVETRTAAYVQHSTARRDITQGKGVADPAKGGKEPAVSFFDNSRVIAEDFGTLPACWVFEFSGSRKGNLRIFFSYGFSYFLQIL